MIDRVVVNEYRFMEQHSLYSLNEPPAQMSLVIPWCRRWDTQNPHIWALAVNHSKINTPKRVIPYTAVPDNPVGTTLPFRIDLETDLKWPPSRRLRRIMVAFPPINRAGTGAERALK